MSNTDSSRTFLHDRAPAWGSGGARKGPSGLREHRCVCACERATVWQTTDHWRRGGRSKRESQKKKKKCARVPSLAPPLKGAELLKLPNVCVLKWPFLIPAALTERERSSACCGSFISEKISRTQRNTFSFKVGPNINWGVNAMEIVITTLAFL